MKPNTLRSATALIVALVALATVTVASGQSSTVLSKGTGSAISEYQVVRGEGNSTFDGFRLRPGVWRLSMALGLDSRLAVATVSDADGRQCAATPPPTVMLIVGIRGGGVCQAGAMQLEVANAQEELLCHVFSTGNIYSGTAEGHKVGTKHTTPFTASEHQHSLCRSIASASTKGRNWHSFSKPWTALFERIAK